MVEQLTGRKYYSPVKAALIAARNKIENEKDWGKGQRGSYRGAARPLETCCAAEAIEECVPVSELRNLVYRALTSAAGIGRHSIVQWNDAPERTHAEVLAAFDKAILESAYV